MLLEWWGTLSVAMKVLWGITLVASLIFVVQTVLTFIGADVDTDFDLDADAVDGGSGLLTFRNFVNFFLGFGWSAILLANQVSSIPVLLVISVSVGVGLVAVVMLLFKWLGSMQQSGNINVYQSAAGCHGTVYLTIPASRSGKGKVQITINDAVREYNAVTDGDALKTGAEIQVIEAVGDDTLLVEEINAVII
ncbi:MAG: hypothetical protein J5871_01305 [Bacteroidales bacterium]|nr:hypothetical protein [Bacteroidales bacterium]